MGGRWALASDGIRIMSVPSIRISTQSTLGGEDCPPRASDVEVAAAPLDDLLGVPAGYRESFRVFTFQTCFMTQPAGQAAYCQSKARYSWRIFRKISPYDLWGRPVRVDWKEERSGEGARERASRDTGGTVSRAAFIHQENGRQFWSERMEREERK